MNVNYAWGEWTHALAERISTIVGAPVEAREVTRPQDENWGDLSFACFKYAKAMGKNPAELALLVAEQLTSALPWVETAVAMGPYVNIRLVTSLAVERVIQDVEMDHASYGFTQPAVEKPVIFEYANPNTHKEIHIGHLRNFTLGAATVRVMKAAGRAVVPVSYVNDVGTNVGKCLWQLVRTQGYSVKELNEAQVDALLQAVPAEQRTGKYLGQLYTEATTLAEDETHTPEISYVQTKLEEHDPAWERLWRVTRDWCIDELHRIFGELGVQVERQYFESTYLDESGRLVDELLSQGIAKESQGAVIVDMEEEKLGILVMRKGDGTLLYAAKDLSLADQKCRDYPDASSLEILVDVRQVPYVKQLAEVMRRRKTALPIESFGYELVRLPEGTMSSRKGTIVTYQGLRDAVFAYAEEGIRTRHADWNAEQIHSVATDLAKAGLIFGMLKQDNDKSIVFDMKEALSFDGATGPYCQYSIVRLSSILRKAAAKGLHAAKNAANAYTHDSEKALAMALATFPSIVMMAGRDQRPSVVAHWCVETAQYVNAFYRDVPVLDATKEEAESRLRLAQAAKEVLIQGLGLLGISVPEEM